MVDMNSSFLVIWIIVMCSLWNYEEGEKMNLFSNQNPRGTRISSLHLINDMHVSLVMVGSGKHGYLPYVHLFPLTHHLHS